MMEKFYVITNQMKDPHLEMTGYIKRYLEEKGRICRVRESESQDGNGGYKYTDPSCVPPDTECVLVLGGDGTLLQASRDLGDLKLPFLGINMGTLGYLAEIDKGHVQAALDRLLEGKFTIEERMMLDGTAWRQHRKMLEDAALNDIAISRRGRLRVIDFHILVDDAFLCSYRADGIIVATPTGSTGYSLSAGGPIVSPEASLILLTAVAPHTLNSRTVILPDNVRVTVELGGDASADSEGAEAIFDGDTSVRMKVGDRIHVLRSSKKTRLIKINHTSFVETLRLKMN